MENLCIPIFKDTTIQKDIVTLVRQQNKRRTGIINEQINEKVYKIYALSNQEIKYIEEH